MVGIPSVVKDRNVDFVAAVPFAILIESRIGRRRNDPPSEADGLVVGSDLFSGGIGGMGARSLMLIGECDRNDSAVSHM